MGGSRGHLRDERSDRHTRDTGNPQSQSERRPALAVNDHRDVCGADPYAPSELLLLGLCAGQELRDAAIGFLPLLHTLEIMRNSL